MGYSMELLAFTVIGLIVGVTITYCVLRHSIVIEEINILSEEFYKFKNAVLFILEDIKKKPEIKKVK